MPDFSITKALRLGEIVMMSGFFIVGSLFPQRKILMQPEKFSLLVFGILSYIAAVYMLNSYAGYMDDMDNPRLASVSRITRKTYFGLMIALAALCVFLLLAVKPFLVPLATIAFYLWMLYYIKGMKGKPYAGTIIHFIAGILHFHLGYAAFAIPDGQSLAISFFFATILCAGHINHELIDFTADARSGLSTTAVKVGRAGARRIVQGLFTISLVAGLLIARIVLPGDKFFYIFPAAAGVTILISPFFSALDPKIFRAFYRSIFGIAGLLYAFARLAL